MLFAAIDATRRVTPVQLDRTRKGNQFLKFGLSGTCLAARSRMRQNPRVRREKSRRGAAATLLFLASAAIVFAKSSTVSAQLEPAAPRTPGWVFTPAINFGGTWNDNILLAEPNDDLAQDYATPVGPSIGLDYTGRRASMSASYTGSFLFYQTLDELNTTTQQLQASWNHRASRRITLFAQENFSRTPTTDALELTAVPFYRVGTTTNTVRGGVEALLVRNTTLRTDYGFTSVEFEDDNALGANLLGGYQHEMLVTLARALSQRLSLGGEYQLRRAVLVEGDDRFNIHTGTLRADYQLSPSTSVSGSAGLSRMGAGATHEARTGPVLQATITRRIRLTVLSAMYHRSFIPSWGFGGTFQNEGWTGNAHVPFGRNRFYVDGSIARMEADALDPAQASLTSLWTTGSLGYRATRWLTMEGYYSHARQNSQVAGGDRRRNELGFRIVAARPMRLR